ncbi:MAG: hypothetical protein RL071_3201 [Pseudomonadota bacterium]
MTRPTLCSTSTRTLWPLAIALLAACRADPGAPAYPAADSAGADTGPGLPQGPDPYVEGEPRLDLGLYYEGGSSERVEINDLDTHYYIYEGTYAERVELQDVIEGREAVKLEVADKGWLGGGLTWDSPRDLSGWGVLAVSLRSGDAGMNSLALHMQAGAEAVRPLADYGWVADGQWHHLRLPLADFAAAGANLAAVTGPYVLIGAGVAPGEQLTIDDLYIEEG